MVQKIRKKSSWYRKSERKAVGTALLQQERGREKLLEKKTEVPSGEFLM